MKLKSLITLTMSTVLLMSAPLFAKADPLAFEVKVTGKGQPMLFIPGATCSGEEWTETVARYHNHYQCHVFTLAGYAGIAPIQPKDYLDTYKTEIIKYIRDKKLNKVILVGHSIGGFLSLCIASEMHDHLQRVIIVDAMPFFAAAFNPNAKDGFNEEMAKNMLAGYDKMDTEKLRSSQRDIAKYLCADSSRWAKIAEWGVQSDHRTMAYTMSEMLGKDMRQQIATIQVPVLVLAAFMPNTSSPLFTSEYVTDIFTKQYQQCKTCIIHVGTSAKHFIMYDAPQWYYQEIDTFIKAG